MDRFSEIIGNEEVKNFLRRIVEKGVVVNSFLFGGMEGVGKSLFAGAFAAMLIGDGNEEKGQGKGIHPDIRVYRPEGKTGMHSIEAMRQFQEEVFLSPLEAKRKVFIIECADRMLSYSANALLKTFEEPPLDSVIILVSSAPQALLPTILSRCQTISFKPIEEDKIIRWLQEKEGKNEEEAKGLASLAQGSLGKALRLAQGKKEANRELLLKVLANGKANHYISLRQTIAALSHGMEKVQKEFEEAARQETLKLPADMVTAAQKAVIEKEIEGTLFMRFLQEVNLFLEVFLSWYRDLHLLHVKGDLAYLFNPDYLPELQQAHQCGEMLSLERVQKAVVDAKLAMERSGQFPVVLENLFLKLSFL